LKLRYFINASQAVDSLFANVYFSDIVFGEFIY